MELEKKTVWIVSVVIVVTSLAGLLARSLPEIAEWPGIHWTRIEDDMS